MINATPQQLRRAANIQERLQSLQKELGQLLGGLGETTTIEAARKPKKRKMSTAGIANIRAAAKARWAKLRAGKAVQKPKRKMSAAAKARLSALAKARWAKAKKAGKSRL